jgi:serine-type D-Ala-D-Ala carboxypeptidase/endopeptidase
MQRTYKYIVSILLALMASGIAYAQPKIPVNPGGFANCPQRKTTTDAAFDAIAAKYSSKIVGMCLGAIGPASGIRPAYSTTKCYGETLFDSHVTPTSHTLFWIGSVTKTMTATLLALRVNESSVNLNDPIDTLLPSQYTIPKITLLQLADMESGLPKFTPYQSPTDENVLYTDLQTCVNSPACWKSVNHYSYSNFGYAVLGNALGDHDGSLKWSLDNTSYLMAPLGMFDTKVSEDYDVTDFLSRRAYGHSVAGGSWTVSRETSESFGGAPAGGLWSTPSDMLIWLGHAMGTLHSDTNVDAALQNTLVCRGPWGNKSKCSSVQDCGRCTGLAWTEDIDQCTGGVRISKSGAVPGFKSWIGFDQKTGRGVFVLLNTGALDGSPVGEDLLEIVP